MAYSKRYPKEKESTFKKRIKKKGAARKRANKAAKKKK